jgi:hypothetical protein
MYFISEKLNGLNSPRNLIQKYEYHIASSKAVRMRLMSSCWTYLLGKINAHQNNTSHRLTLMVKLNGAFSYLKQEK